MTIPHRARRFIGRLLIPLYLAWSRISPGLRTVLLWVITLLALTLPFLLAGCHAPTPARVALPSVQPVQSAVTKAKHSNATAVDLARIAEQSGIAAGSASAHALTIATANTEEALSEAQALSATLAAAQTATQKQVDSQTQRLADVQAKYDAAVKTIWWYRVRFWGPLTFALLAVAIYLLTRFTGWGARTFGPYILGVEKVAAKAAILA